MTPIEIMEKIGHVNGADEREYRIKSFRSEEG